MPINGLIDAIASSLNNQAKFGGLIGSAKAASLAALAKKNKQLLLVTTSASEAESLRKEIEFFAGLNPQIFPALDVMPEDQRLPSKELVGERYAILNKWQQGQSSLVIAPLKALKDKTCRNVEQLKIMLHQTLERETLINRLIEFGYKRFDIVGEAGEFCLRGGIIDIYPAGALYPIRLELSADKIESLRSFDPFTQRSREKLSESTIFPVFERGEATVLDILPKETIVVVDELISLARVAEAVDYDLAELIMRRNLEISALVGEGEEPLFLPVPSYLGGTLELPAEALIISHHSVRLKEEFPEKNIFPGELRGGFVFGHWQIITDRELFGEEPTTKKVKEQVHEGVAEELLSDLKVGDYVVHDEYGIGIYLGMETLELEDLTQEYLLIQFAGEDKLYVPPAMLGMVQKYSAGRESLPKLSRLGSKEWVKTRSRVKQEIHEMTKELIELYAIREKTPGYAFQPDDIWQKELDATFPYEVTPDQAKAIAAVKKDMEAARPMDRLICGDVGYGKTEVAIRAAAKASAAGKQVAVLAPTTILVEQHYNNFQERFKQLPFKVEMLSRFRSKAEQQGTVDRLAIGQVDIVIGTHRLLSKDIHFKDLGLMIVDEEQKFGVAHKEKLKKLRKNVDIITLTATPIPRTMYFSLSGLRELSLISTPPVDRSPIRTYVMPYSETVTREVIRRELDRGGQVFFVFNHVDKIIGTAAKIKKLVPEANIAIAHGQMDEKRLERTMLDFMAKKFDVLVCTSIIESGLDIPNVNTIIIDQADRFGLSQLYQIRGRVGRSAARAYAYLFYHPGKLITEVALERLKAIQEFTALGSGYKLAMRDLEIRGAGNLLGAQQSGHIYEVGFDLYCELLEEAVKELKGETVVSPREIEIDLQLAAYIPSGYVPDERQRIALYQRMNLITTAEGITELKRELIDRFGKIPEAVELLIKVVQLKVAALQAGVKSIKERDNVLEIEWLIKKSRHLAIGKGDKLKIAMRGIAG